MEKYIKIAKNESRDLIERSLLNRMFYGDILKKYRDIEVSDIDNIIVDIFNENDFIGRLDMIETITETINRIEKLKKKGKLENIDDAYFYLIKSLHNIEDKKGTEFAIGEFFKYLDEIFNSRDIDEGFIHKRISELLSVLYIAYSDNRSKREKFLRLISDFITETGSIDISSVYVVLSVEYSQEDRVDEYYRLISVVADKIKDKKLDILDKIQLENIMIIATEENFIDEAYIIANKIIDEYGYNPNAEFVRVRKILNEFLESKIEKEEAEKRINEVLKYIKDYSSNLSDEENKYIYFLSKLETIKTFGEDEKIPELINEIKESTDKSKNRCELCMIILLECYVLTNDVDNFKKLYREVKNSQKLSQHKDIMDFIDYLNDELS